MDLNTGDNHTRTTTDALKGDRNGTINHREMARQTRRCTTSCHLVSCIGQKFWRTTLGSREETKDGAMEEDDGRRSPNQQKLRPKDGSTNHLQLGPILFLQ
jgi:hypothetical protein